MHGKATLFEKKYSEGFFEGAGVIWILLCFSWNYSSVELCLLGDICAEKQKEERGEESSFCCSAAFLVLCWEV